MMSPAIDKGKSFGLTTDQRGIFRPSDNPNIGNAPGGDGADIGAFEVTAPTAASVSISGRVLTQSSRDLLNAVVLTDTSGSMRTAQTTSFGYFHFEEVAAGQTYVFSVNSKRYQFAPQVINITDQLTDLNFMAQP